MIELKTKNYLEKITEIYAFVSSDKDGEGIIAKSVPSPAGGWMLMPLIAADKERLQLLKPIAKEIAKEGHKKVKLIRLTPREEIEEYDYTN